jgi:hypothetical protein
MKLPQITVPVVLAIFVAVIALNQGDPSNAPESPPTQTTDAKTLDIHRLPKADPTTTSGREEHRASHEESARDLPTPLQERDVVDVPGTDAGISLPPEIRSEVSRAIRTGARVPENYRDVRLPERVWADLMLDIRRLRSEIGEIDRKMSDIRLSIGRRKIASGDFQMETFAYSERDTHIPAQHPPKAHVYQISGFDEQTQRCFTKTALTYPGESTELDELSFQKDALSLRIRHAVERAFTR